MPEGLVECRLDGAPSGLGIHGARADGQHPGLAEVIRGSRQYLAAEQAAELGEGGLKGAGQCRIHPHRGSSAVGGFEGDADLHAAAGDGMLDEFADAAIHFGEFAGQLDDHLGLLAVDGAEFHRCEPSIRCGAAASKPSHRCHPPSLPGFHSSAKPNLRLPEPGIEMSVNLLTARNPAPPSAASAVDPALRRSPCGAFASLKSICLVEHEEVFARLFAVGYLPLAI